ncbi:esterase/lipase family protein [Alcanivorax limicola]|uniref:esterase/lipase family protein n=1 Tax=Alcanivorax limicola TaxID=2874102 RepID=UPI001CBCE612|nr:triacylglycerol lipase [Alcanivorax limicola]
MTLHRRLITASLLCVMALSSINAQASSFWERLFGLDTYTQTQHPIVLLHGMFGFDDVLGVDYFYKVAEELSRSGAEVYTLQVSALNSTEVRGEQAARQIEDIIAASGATQVNIIGHSHGGPTARYVASVYPQMVASVSSVAGVNWGTPVADLYIESVQDTDAGPFVKAIGEAFATMISWASGGSGLPQDLDASIHDLSTDGSLAFNALYPEGMPTEYCGQGQEVGSNGVRYYSWSGTGIYTNALDPFDYLVLATSSAFDEPNDGLVAACSSHLGRVLRTDYNQNHFDEVNQSLGLTAWFGTDPLTVYRQQANRLKNAGL